MSDTDSLLERIRKLELEVKDIQDSFSKLWSEFTGLHAKYEKLDKWVGMPK